MPKIYFINELLTKKQLIVELNEGMFKVYRCKSGKFPFKLKVTANIALTVPLRNSKEPLI